MSNEGEINRTAVLWGKVQHDRGVLRMRVPLLGNSPVVVTIGTQCYNSSKQIDVG